MLVRAASSPRCLPRSASRLSRRPRWLPLIAALLASAFALGCGGAGAALTRGTLPQAEVALLDLVPRDAFMAGRLDVGALQATPHWALILDQLRADEPLLAEFVADTGHAYFAVGGLVQAPPVPPLHNEQGDYQSPPAWAELAEALHGRIPKLVAIAEGGVARACLLAGEGREARERGGYRIVDVNGVALLTRGDAFCAMTWTPLVDALLAETGPTADVAAHLATAGGGIAQLALRLDSPVVADILADVPAPPAPLTDEEIELPEWLSAEDADRYRTDVRAARAREHRFGNFARAVTRLVSHGLVAASWQLRDEGDGFETRTQVVADDDGRMTMWRELTELHFDILRAAVSYELLSGDEHPLLAEFVRDVTIVEQRGGYQIVRHTRHEVVARMLRAMVPAPVVQYAEAVEDPGASEREELRERLHAASERTATEAIEAIEPNLAFVREEHRSLYFREATLRALASSYASVGRFDDARQISVAEQEHLNSSPAGYDEEWLENDGQQWVASHGADVCETHLTQGNAELALAAPAGDGRGVPVYDVTACRAAALAMLGRVDEALALLEAAHPQAAHATRQAASWVRVLALAGRHEEALAVMRALCLGGPGADACVGFAVMFADAVAATARTVDDAQPAFTALHQRYRADGSSQLGNERAVRVQAADCALRVRLQASAEETRAACATALERATATHGSSHPAVAAAHTAYAAALQAARQRAEAAAQREAAAPIIEGLGPQHPLRARPARRR